MRGHALRAALRAAPELRQFVHHRRRDPDRRPPAGLRRSRRARLQRDAGGSGHGPLREGHGVRARAAQDHPGGDGRRRRRPMKQRTG